MVLAAVFSQIAYPIYAPNTLRSCCRLGSCPRRWFDCSRGCRSTFHCCSTCQHRVDEDRLSDCSHHFYLDESLQACENMISGKSVVPSDILTASNGKTIEVMNTDVSQVMFIDFIMTANSHSMLISFHRPKGD